jgi:mitofilin
VPLTPPSPSKVQSSPPTSLGSAPPAATASTPPPPPPKKSRKLIRKLFLTLLALSVGGFAGGVYYSRVNDNFHDFFTEYIPFGEEAVLYFEERDFRKRFPVLNNKPRNRELGNRVTIPSSSGVSWKLAEDKPAQPDVTKDATAKTGGAPDTTHKEKVASVKGVKKPQVSDATAPAAAAPLAAAEAKSASEPAVKPTVVDGPAPVAAKKVPEVNEPSVYTPYVERIDPINIKNANDPVVQDLVKIVNDIILVVNADKAGNKFSPVIKNAKSELSKVGDKVQALKAIAMKEADEKVKASHEDFDRAAKELIRRLEGEMHEQEGRWKEEYEEERSKLQQHYEQRLRSEIAHAKDVNEQRLRNELLEQAVEMKRKFVAEVNDRVEEERNNRLGKLTDLSKTVEDLEKLTTGWTDVVDSNLKTQHLHVAVEAVRANLENSRSPKPFVRELAALKEIAAADPVVDAAIASINPLAYQRGIPTSAQLIDRFRRVAGEVRKASLLPDEAGVASHASSYVLSKLLFKKRGMAAGDDVESILTRTETYLEEGNLDEAAREMNGLTGWAKTLSRDWLGEARKVLEVQQALDVSLSPFSLDVCCGGRN